MADLRQAAQQALEALRIAQEHWRIYHVLRSKTIDGAIAALRAALAQEEQEPVASAWIHDGVMVNAFPWPPGDPRGCDGDQYWQGKGYAASPLYAAPPRREWQSLTEEDIADAQDAAAIHFRESRHGVRGQQLMPSDSPDWWLARAIEAKLKEKNQ